MYERQCDPLLPKPDFVRRVLLHGMLGLVLLVASLAFGVAGYMLLEDMALVDAVLNAAMILGGMGPVATLATPAGKYFASFYALFSGVVFLVVAGVLVAPFAHRLLHRFHLDEADLAGK